MSKEISRRDLLFSLAASLLLSQIPSGLVRQRNSYSDVDWEMVLNKVIGDRNALMMGFGGDIGPYKVGSPEWCMEEALAGRDLLAEGAQVHV